MQTPSAPDRSAWAGTIARYGGVSSYGVWKVAIDAYYWDKLQQAHDVARELGVTFGWQEWWYRLIEAEALTREVSEITELQDQVSFEHVPAQLPHVSHVISDILHACTDVRARFGWQEGAKTMVSVLSEHTDAPWTVGRAGYMMDKYPYDKICLPWNVTHDSTTFQSVVRHEYAHVMVLNLTAGKAATYLHEAVTMMAQDWPRTADWVKFAQGSQPWLDPIALTNAFNDQHDPERAHARSLAYSQSSALGYYLKSIGGERKIGELLRAFGDNSTWTDLKMTLTGQSPADEALRQVYGFGEKELFERAKARLVATHGSVNSNT